MGVKRTHELETGMGLSQSARKRMRTAFRNAKEEIESEDEYNLFLPPLSSVRQTDKIIQENIKDITPESAKNKAMEYFLMLKAFKNIQKTDVGILKTKHSFQKKVNSKTNKI